jgi:hypothetical protein
MAVILPDPGSVLIPHPRLLPAPSTSTLTLTLRSETWPRGLGLGVTDRDIPSSVLCRSKPGRRGRANVVDPNDALSENR